MAPPGCLRAAGSRPEGLRCLWVPRWKRAPEAKLEGQLVVVDQPGFAAGAVAGVLLAAAGAAAAAADAVASEAAELLWALLLHLLLLCGGQKVQERGAAS